jgi:hypothetical protein
MALLKVTTAKQSKGLLKVTTNKGMQGSKVKVQGGNVPGTALQGGSPYYPIQGGNVSGSWLQGGSAWLVQSARAAAKKAAKQKALRVARQKAIEQARRIAAAAALREKKRRETQAKLDKKVGVLRNYQRTEAKSALEYLAKTPDFKDWRQLFDLSGNFKYRGQKDDSGFVVPESWLELDPRYEAAREAWAKWYNSPEGESQRVKDEYRRRAEKIIDDHKKGGGDSFLDKFFDKITFGGTRRAMEARSMAEEFGRSTANTQAKRYETDVNAFLKKQADMRARVQAKKFSSWAEYNKVMREYSKWEAEELARLRYMKAATEGTVAGYDAKSKEKLTNLPGKVGNWLQDNIVNGAIGQITGGIWKYTLGSGDAAVPSLVTAPSRAVNALSNLISGRKTIVGKDGKERKSTGNAWLDSFNQSNLNGKAAALTYENYARNRYLQIKNGFQTPASYLDMGKKKQAKFDAAEFERWERQNRNELQKSWRSDTQRAKDTYSFANDIALDPLSYFGLSKIGQKAGTGIAESASKWLGRATKPLSSSKFGKTATNLFSSIKASKPVTWLGAEAKSPQQKYFDAVTEANRVTDEAQRTYLPRLRSRQAILAKEKQILKGKFDDSLIDDFRIMAERGDDEAARWLQQMRNGEFSQKAKILNWTRAGGVGSNPRLTNLKELADRWSDFADEMLRADKVATDRIGKGKKFSFYSPRTKYVEDYNFRKEKKNFKPQSAQDLYRGVVDRYFKSDVINYWGDNQKSKIKFMDDEIERILGEYGRVTDDAASNVERAYAKTRTPYGRLRGATGKFGPTALWKKSVLKYRPAWYVNNFLYNTQGAALAGGGRALVEQAKLFRPKNYRHAVNELPENVKTQVASEIGTGKIAKFGNALENVSRMGAYRALIKQGYTPDAALKRVNSYLFDYSTKNYERPIKAVLPFYSFQKGLAKAAVKMPGDRPLAAIAYNRLDRAQQQQFETDFDKIVPELEKLGYSEVEIAEIRKQQAQIYKGRLKIGDRYITTPFNAFSEKAGFGGGGINPWISSLAEASSAKDSFGRQLSGEAASFGSRVFEKFPQASLAKKGLDKYLIASGRKKPVERWIGAEGSGGYGMTKEAQGYDPSKPNYKESLDAGAKFDRDLAAFFGAPRGLKFDTTKLLEQKKLQKLKSEYFAVDWNDLPFQEQEKRRGELFKKYGITADEFYDGILAKYDSANTKKIKAMKDEAYEKTQKLFAEYSAQPKGTRNVWATKKLKELVDSGYFAKNPFLKSFDWTNPDTIAKAQRKMAYDQAKATGNWSAFAARRPRKTSQKALDYREAKRTGDWSAYERKYGAPKKSARAKFWAAYADEKDPAKRREMLRDHPEYAKRKPKSEAQIAEARFWSKYAAASVEDRRELLKKNPKYNRRSNWTPQMWDKWKIEKKALQKKTAMRNSKFAELMLANLATNNAKAAPVLAKKARSRAKPLAFSTR